MAKGTRKLIRYNLEKAIEHLKDSQQSLIKVKFNAPEDHEPTKILVESAMVSIEQQKLFLQDVLDKW